ncbi:MAG: ATP-binding cassette domain-containing protein [Hyphomicrobiaceae bacterium]|nr:ATP-binding cassette domain-containing protein [Hyphomicrobiaceae bacterium]
MAAPLITLADIRLTFGGTPLLTGAGLNVVAGDRIALVGRNGSGKSTLLKIAAGEVQPDSGDRFVHPGAVVRYLPQEANFAGFDTTLDYVEAGLKPTDDPYRARKVLEELGLTGEEGVMRLSGGEARRAALARVIAAEPDVLLLDEPTNHLDLPAIEWLERLLGGLRSAVLMISHDRRFLETLSRSTVWLDRGITRRMDAGFDTFETWRDGVLEQEESESHKLDRKIVREEKWMHGGVTARRKRNMRRVRELAALRQQRRDHRRAVGSARLETFDAEQSGRLVIEAEGLVKAYGDRVVVGGFSTRVMRGDRVGLVGPNGAGKTTLLKMLIGQLVPDAGTVKLGTNLEMVLLDQKRDELKPEWTVAEAMTRGRGDQVIVNGKARHVASYMKDFLFLPEQVRSPVSVLSGGERARLMLARVLAMPSNFLVLDEPTNDLDLETLDLLQELIADYSGTVLLVSHDRDFLDRIVTTTIASEGDGRWEEYAGGYSDMLARRRAGQADIGASGAIAQSGREKAAAKSPGAPAAAAKRKMSFKEKHALETLPATIDKLGADIATLEREMADPALAARDPSALTKLATRLAEAQHALGEAENRWLELEMLREDVEGPSRT